MPGATSEAGCLACQGSPQNSLVFYTFIEFLCRKESYRGGLLSRWAGYKQFQPIKASRKWAQPSFLSTSPQPGMRGGEEYKTINRQSRTCIISSVGSLYVAAANISGLSHWKCNCKSLARDREHPVRLVLKSCWPGTIEAQNSWVGQVAVAAVQNSRRP